jgi:hypothetical protein
MAHLVEDKAEDLGLLYVKKEGTEFGYGGRGGDEFQDSTERVDGSVQE